MEDNKELVTEEVTENVEEQTTEEVVEEEEGTTEEVETKDEPQKVYTEEEFNQKLNEKLDDILPKKIARIQTKTRKEYEKKYSDYSRLGNVVTTGLGVDSIEEATKNLTEYYKEQGISIPEKSSYSQRELDILANAEADEIISAGYEDIVEEVERLAEIGVDKMTPQEKIMFSKLAKERTRIEDKKSLASIGLKEESLPEDFNDFAKNLNPKLTLKEKYEMYLKFNPKPKGEKIGSMKSENSNKVKDHYTQEEISRMTDEELDDPVIWEAVRKSMTKA